MWYEHQYCLIIDNRIVAGSDVLMQEVKDSGYDHIDDFFLAKVTPAANIKLPIWEGKLFIPENSDEDDELNLEKRRFNAWAGKRSLLNKRRFNAWAGRR